MSIASFSIYNASAGSGKTHTLVKEYLKILLKDRQDDAYKKILAITFTNKAVEEMKSRIVNSLYAFSLETIPEKFVGMFQQLVEETGLKESEVQNKSAKIIKSIIHNYAAFDISTIDKFTHKVIRSFAFDLNLPVTFDVTLESEELLREAVDAIISRAGSDKQLTDLLIDFSLDKADDDKSWDITRELLEIGYLLMNENNREEIALFEEKTLDDFVRVRDFLKKEIRALTEYTKNIGSEALEILTNQGIDLKSFSRGTFPNHLMNITKDDVKPAHKRFMAFEDIQINKTAKDRDLIEAHIPRLLELLKKVYESYSKRAFNQAFLKNITPLSLLNTIGVELKKIQEEQKVLSITQFNSIIYNEIQNQPAPFIYERMGERYRHFFIDEFQDTSEMQWLNLIPLIDNALAGEDEFGIKGTLMIVGDPKQSIYRWRGGKAEQFIELSKGKNPFSNPEKETVVLGKNYRSYSEVIKFNNKFFKTASERFNNVDYKDLYENNSFQECNSKVGGYVSIQFLEEGVEDLTSEEQYTQATFDVINKIKERGFDYSDIVILTRKRSEGVALANFLTEKEIPILSSDSLLINNATEVRLIINVLRFLRNQKDLEAKAMMLYFVASRQLEGVEVHDFIVEGLSMERERELEGWLFTKGVVISFESCRRKSLYEAVEQIIRAFLQDKSSISYVLYFLDLVLERSIKNHYGISDFIEYWGDNYQKFSIPTPEGVDAVQIMTIHKSKGLEFPVVIFPFAEEDYSRSNRDKLWLDIEDGELDFPKALVDSKKEVMEYGEMALELYESKEQEELLDNLNVLYVALTRAEEQLYVISKKNLTSKGELKNNMSTFFMEFLMKNGFYNDNDFCFDFGNPVRLSVKQLSLQNQDFENKTIQSVDVPLDFKSIKIAQREALMWDSVSQKSIEYGNLIHKVLSYVTGEEDIENALQTCVENGYLTEVDTLEIGTIVRNIVMHPELKEYFDSSKMIYNERAIMCFGQKNSIPDRVLTDGKKAYVLDYKTGKPSESHKAQVQSYGSLLEEMGFEVMKKALLYTGDVLKVIHL